MKIPPILGLTFRMQKNMQLENKKETPYLKPLKNDTISFTSTAQYLKKYNTLPSEIKKALSPKDAIDMFKNMEMVANGSIEGDKIALGEKASVYENHWLDNFCFMVLTDNTPKKLTVYSEVPLGDAVWSDNENERIQIVELRV